MRVFSQINNCQQKQNKSKKQTKQKGALLLGLAKSIYYGEQQGEYAFLYQGLKEDHEEYLPCQHFKSNCITQVMC